ncbi:HNH endonuclease [Psychrobacter piscatorii]|uniref:HNH endonuclease n=1 Tax=Psychrobacter piscatorii TaxID=554343 RepID=UPI0037358A9E
MKKCYLCGLDFNNSSVKQHKEHIVQQAIGGNLTCKDILCESCGSKLNNSIDIEFNKIFETTSVLLGIKRDRKDISKKRIIGKHQAFIPEIQEVLDERDISVTWSDGKVYPNKPFEIYSDLNKKITIYSNSKVAEHFKKKVENDFREQHPNSPLPEIIICGDLYGLTSFDFKLDNKTFKQGLAKIAVNYALFCGLSREQLTSILCIHEDNKQASFTKNPSVIPFYPLSIIDKLIEDKKADFQPYPTHTLILFNSLFNPNVLVCYIDLFSTYQHYVLLSNNYSGPNIYKSYPQKILFEKESIFEPYRHYYKDRSRILSSLNITKEDLEATYRNRNGSKEDAEYRLITQRQNEQRYNINLEEYLDSIIDTIMIEEVDKLHNETDLSIVKSLFDNMNLFYCASENDERSFNIDSFRRYYIDSAGRKVDYVDEICNEYKKSLEEIKYYNHKKFYDLQIFHNNKNIDKKTSN